jgi:rubrerythrin
MDHDFDVDEDREADVLLQALESEAGAANVYRMALECTRNAELREALDRNIAETEGRRRSLLHLCYEAGLDPTRETPGRARMREVLRSLTRAMHLALREGPGEVAEIVAARCVVHAETSGLNWELVREVARMMRKRRRHATVPGWGRHPDARAVSGTL